MTMKREQIERLAMDRAAGELNPDAEALLQAYLDEHPQAKPWAEDMSTIYVETESAIAAKSEVAVPAMGVISTNEHGDRNVSRWSVLGRAAVVIFAVLIGVGIGRFSQTETTESKSEYAVAQHTQTESSRVSDLPGSEGGFWRGRALASLQTRPYRTHETSKENAGFWQRYKTGLKENNYD